MSMVQSGFILSILGCTSLLNARALSPCGSGEVCSTMNDNLLGATAMLQVDTKKVSATPHTEVQEITKQLSNSKGLEESIQRLQDEYETRHLHQYQRFMGVRFGQHPMDAQIITEILYEVKPDLIVETGTNTGGSAIWLAHHMSIINSEAKIITCDPKHPDEWAAEWNKVRPCENVTTKALWGKVEYVQEISTSETFVNRVAQLAQPSKRVLVLLDSDHSTKNVEEELAALSKFVTPGSYVIVEDTFSTRTPMVAVKKFLETHTEFEADVSREYLLWSQHAHGYLRRS